jgi:hypothetical protein
MTDINCLTDCGGGRDGILVRFRRIIEGRPSKISLRLTVLLSIHRRLQRSLHEGNRVCAVTFVVVAFTGTGDLLPVRGLKVPTPHALGIAIHLIMHCVSRQTFAEPLAIGAYHPMIMTLSQNQGILCPDLPVSGSAHPWEILNRRQLLLTPIFSQARSGRQETNFLAEYLPKTSICCGKPCGSLTPMLTSLHADINP